MTKVVLEIKNPGDWQVLLPLLRRLKIRFFPIEAELLSPNDAGSETLEIINAGLPAFDNFEEWIQQFEASREDRLLPFRQN